MTPQFLDSQPGNFLIVTAATLTSAPALWLTALATLLAVLRLTRLITTDSLGARYVIQPAARKLLESQTTKTKRATERGGKPSQFSGLFWLNSLGCPFCVGYWIGAAVTIVTVALALATAIWSDTAWPGVYLFWLLLLTTLALNYVVGHIAIRLDRSKAAPPIPPNATPAPTPPTTNATETATE